MKPRSLELFGYLGVLEDIQAQGSRTPLIRKYEPGSQKPFKTWAIEPWLEPLPDRPDVSGFEKLKLSMYLMMRLIWQRNGLAVSQSVTEAILRSHIEKYSCHVELATRLQSFEQKSDHVVAQLVKTTDDGQEVPETLSVKFLLGSDGARGTIDVLAIRFDAELFVIRRCTKDAWTDFRGPDMRRGADCHR